MNQTDPSARPEPEAPDDTARVVAMRGVESGAVTATLGAIGLLSGLRAYRAGRRTLGLAEVALGVGLLTAALVQRRSHDRSGELDVEETDVVDTDASAGESLGAGEEDHATSETADIDVDSQDPSAAVERETADVSGEGDTSAEPTAEETTDVDDGTEIEEIERLGAAAFDSQSREVPAPQQAFNRGFLAHSSMVCWGIRARDDAVLIAQDYDVIEGLEGVTYVASSEIGTDVRELPIPDPVLNHWDEVIRGGTAVTGGDDILFVTTETLAADGLLRVLPAKWADDLTE